MRRYFINILIFASILLISVPVSADNHYVYGDLGDLQDMDGRLGIPTFRVGDDLFFSGSASNDELSLNFPIITDNGGGNSGNNVNMLKVTISTTGVDGIVTSSTDERLFISLMGLDTPGSESISGTLIEANEDTEHLGIYTLNTDLQKKANGQLLILPLINYPEGTQGYVMPVLYTEVGYIVPLIQMPKGHLNNWHGLENEWDLEYDRGIAINYFT